MEDAAWWKMRYELLHQEYEAAKKRNEELEERMLNLVEHIELDKQIAIEKIERLNNELLGAVNKVTFLENECARYKKDCVLAVHLLHCQPSCYVASQTAPEIFAMTADEEIQSPLVARGIPTFPPMAVYLPEQKLNEAFVGLTTVNCSKTSEVELSNIKPSPSFTSQFIEKIKNDEDYSYVELRKCEKCSTVMTVISRETQTPIPQPPRPKIMDMDNGFFTEQGNIHVV